MADEKRYQVFVSSTYTDLTEERAAVIQAILRMDHLPAGMEMFPSADESQWELIEQVIDQSDYYIVVVAGRYGSIIDAEGISYTEKEYDYAVDSGIPVLGFVHKHPGHIPAEDTDLDKDAQELLDKFRDKVKSRPVNFFESPAELGGLIVTSLMQAIKKKPGVGWVRGDKAMTVEVEKEILDLRKDLAAAEKAQEDATRSLVEDTSQLKQGEEEITIPYRLNYRQNYKRYYQQSPVTASWDKLFSGIGPLLIDEASVKQARERCDSELAKLVSQEDLEVLPKDAEDIGTTLTNESWETIEFQLRALGLIDTGVKKTCRPGHK
ncbi:DUF4062 domain-containing protein [Williamsia sp. M5A3_1d]